MAYKTVYLRSCGAETVAYEDQITSGVWHIPPKATEIKPPSFTDKQTCKFVGDKWVVEDIPEPEPEPEQPEPTYADKRRAEYPNLQEVTVALAEKAEGDSTMWEDITAKRASVKAKFPKP